MTALDTRRRIAGEILIPLALAASEASMTLKDWRAEAGAKSGWSNHVKLHERGLFGRLETAAAALGNALVEVIPAHWQMQDYAFRPARMGGKLTWSGKGGRAQAGMAFQADRGELVSTIGTFAALATADTTGEEDASRMSAIGLSPDEVNRFLFHRPHTGYVEGLGCTPRDAYARALLRDDVRVSLRVPRVDLDPDAAFLQGMGNADRLVATGAAWSAAPTLWDRLLSDTRLKALMGRGFVKDRRGLKPSPEDFTAFDTQVALALRLLGNIPKPGPKADFLIRDQHDIVEVTSGWCGTSAILEHLVRNVTVGQYMRNDVLGWQVFAMGDEKGHRARLVVSRFETAEEMLD